MSAAITLKHTMARRSNVALHLVQHGLLIGGLILAIGLISFFSGGASTEALANYAPAPATANAAEQAAEANAERPAALLPNMQGALDYVGRRYRVSPQALQPIFEAAQVIGRERRIDPLLIVAMIGVESGFNPFAESTMGAQGLMQVIPRFHMDKLPPNSSAEHPLLDPLVNIRVGTLVLEEAIRRRGGLIAGLQYYAGSSDGENAYANKVLAEKERLEQAARRNLKSSA